MSNHEAKGIAGIEVAYSQAMYVVKLYGPTWFVPVVRQTASIATQYHRQNKYFVLLIIIDGEILNMQDTSAAIVEASYLPLSLFIVGVGYADYSTMNFLESDKKELTPEMGRVALCDIIQFVSICGKFF